MIKNDKVLYNWEEYNLKEWEFWILYSEWRIDKSEIKCPFCENSVWINLEKLKDNTKSPFFRHKSKNNKDDFPRIILAHIGRLQLKEFPGDWIYTFYIYFLNNKRNLSKKKLFLIREDKQESFEIYKEYNSTTKSEQFFDKNWRNDVLSQFP